MTRSNSSFTKGSGCYTCHSCGKKTRTTYDPGAADLELCQDCFDDAGDENTHNDQHWDENGDRLFTEGCTRCDKEKAALAETMKEEKLDDLPPFFTKENLLASKGGSETWIEFREDYIAGGGTRFVARFKYGRASAGPFMTCLRSNISPAEYFRRYDAGETPLQIAESFGFVLSHIKKWLKKDGYPQNRAGYQAWLAHRLTLPNVALTK